MKIGRIRKHYVSLAFFAVVTVAVIAAQSRANQQYATHTEPLLAEVAGQVSLDITRKLGKPINLHFLRGHN